MVEILITLFIFLIVLDIFGKIKSLSELDEAVNKEIENHGKKGGE
jgi:hypothetical protein